MHEHCTISRRSLSRSLLFACNHFLIVMHVFMSLNSKTVNDLQVRDAGRTEVAAGSTTVLAIGGITDFVDQVTGKLKTY